MAEVLFAAVRQVLAELLKALMYVVKRPGLFDWAAQAIGLN